MSEQDFNQRSFVVYGPGGFIIRFGMAPAEQVELQATNANEKTLLVEEMNVTDATHYVDVSDVDSPALSAKTPMSYTVNDNVVSDLPIPCRAVYNNAVYDVADGVITLDSDIPGEYLIHVYSIEYLDEEIKVVIP